VVKRVVRLADPVDEDSAVWSSIIEELGLKAVRAKRTAEVMVLYKAGVDLILLDMKSDTMNPDTILPEVGQKAGIPIVICSADGSREDAITAMRYGCLDWVDKPIEAESAKEILTSSLRRSGIPVGDSDDITGSRDLVKEIARRIRDGDIALPDVPRVVDTLDATLIDDTASVAVVADVVRRCPSLSARLVSLANTETFGGKMWQGSIVDLPGAVERLGNLTISNLLQGEVLKDRFHFKNQAFRQVFERMWRAHYMSACLTRAIAETAQLGDPEEMYLLGLLHNVGELFLLRVFGELYQRHNNQLLQMDEVLSNIRDWHTTFGSALINKWDLGQEFADVTKYHHDRSFFETEGVDPELIKKLHAVNLADQLTTHMGYKYYKRPPASFAVQESYETLELPAETKDSLREKAQEIVAELKSEDQL
jgi:HD-like signal output (HDOD) protein